MVGIVAAAGCAFVANLYKGMRAAFIVSQLSVLFGILFVISCNNLWAVILCHAFYNTVAFVCFVNESPKYSNLELPN